MDDGGMNHYEQQLYTVFKTFDVDNAEALDRAAVLQLCDALQLEGRGAALVDSLFERRAERVTFATFRNGLLSVLGADPAPPPPPAPPPAPDHSDDDSSGREVAPKFVFGSKKYGRRSRPARAADEPVAPRAASASRVDADAAGPRARMRYKRSASAMEARDPPPPPPDLLDHERRIDRAQAAALCRDLRMHAVDPRLVDRIFEDASAEETTVGEFFDRLNAALTPLAAGEPAPAPPPEPPDADDAEVGITGETVADAWERAGVRRPRRLLAELGFTGSTLNPVDLERALDEELGALPARDERDARPLLQQAALALSRLRRSGARARAAAAAAERDKLRADLVEANRRAQLLAQDVDENHARLEAERQAALRQLEARHAEAARALAEEAAAERERAVAQRAELEAELARRGDAEARLRAELAALRLRADRLERRASEAEERALAADRERTRAEEEALETAARAGREEEERRAARSALERQVLELREDNARLRDRADELAAGLEARRGAAPPPAAAASWRDEAELDAAADAALDRIEECDSSPSSIERLVLHAETARRLRAVAGSLSPACARCAAAAATLRELADAPPAVDAAVQTEPATGDADLNARIAELQQKHQAEKADLNNLVAELEGSVEALREEYERCEEYWAGKLAEERAAAADEAAAGDARLAELLARVAEYEAAFRPRLPALHESQFEAQYDQLAQEFSAFKAEAARALAEARAELERAPPPPPVQAPPTPVPAPPTPPPPPACSCRQRDAPPRAAAASDGEQHASSDGEQRTASDGEQRTASDGEQRTASDGEQRTASDGEQRAASDGEQCAASSPPADSEQAAAPRSASACALPAGQAPPADRAPAPADPAPAPAAPAGHAPGQPHRAPPPHPTGGCACAALALAWRRAAAAEGAGLRARAAHAERAAARLLARLQAADALVADLYRENCSLQHHARREPHLL